MKNHKKVNGVARHCYASWCVAWVLLNSLLLSAMLHAAMTPPGNALSFNGTTQDVDVGTGATLNFTGAMTIEAWVKPTSQYNMQAFFGHKNGGSANPGYSLFINSYNTTDAKLRFETQSAAFSTSSAAITWGVWQHVAVTWNGTAAHIYVNGVEQAAGGGVTLVSSTVNGRIGSNSNGGA